MHPYETLLALVEGMGFSSKAGMIQEMHVKILFGCSSSIMFYTIFLQHVIRGRKKEIYCSYSTLEGACYIISNKEKKNSLSRKIFEGDSGNGIGYKIPILD